MIYTRSGAYFVTLATQDRERLFGEISNGQMRLSLIGQCVSTVLQNLPNHFDIALDAFVIMPDHIHLVIIIKENEHEITDIDLTSNHDKNVTLGQLPNGTVPNSLGAIIQNFKSVTSRKINGQRSRQAEKSGKGIILRGSFATKKK